MTSRKASAISAVAPDISPHLRSVLPIAERAAGNVPHFLIDCSEPPAISGRAGRSRSRFCNTDLMWATVAFVCRSAASRADFALSCQLAASRSAFSRADFALSCHIAASQSAFSRAASS